MQTDPPTSSPHASELARLCQARDDEPRFRRLAWACSICALFLLIGIIGMLAPGPTAQLSDPVKTRQLVPVVFAPFRGSTPQDSPTPKARNETVETLAASRAPISVNPVAFPASQGENIQPVEVLTPLPPSPGVRPASAVQPEPTISRYEPGSGTPNTPQPPYPALALRRGYEGTVRIEFTVAPSGQITATRIGQSSGHSILDEAALETVRAHWQFPAGQVRQHFVEIVFQLR